MRLRSWCAVVGSGLATGTFGVGTEQNADVCHRWGLWTNWPPICGARVCNWPFSCKTNKQSQTCTTSIKSRVLWLIMSLCLSLSFSLLSHAHTLSSACIIQSLWYAKLNIIWMPDLLFSFSLSLFLFNNNSLELSTGSFVSTYLGLFRFIYPAAWQNMTQAVLDKGGK